MSNTSSRIAKLNDQFRQTFQGGKVIFTTGISSLPMPEQVSIQKKVRAFDTFTEDNDPYKEHDFGAFKYHGKKIFWKIDYYDSSMQYGSEDPADPLQTTRVLTIMLAEEY